MRVEARLPYSGNPPDPTTRSGDRRRSMRLTIGMKLLGGFFGLALLMAGLGVFSLIQMARVRDVSAEISQN